MSLDELMSVPVTSVSKHESTIGQSPAAIAVITQDDIQRSGSTNIPDALRMVPGMEVAQTNSYSWAISTRGFNDGSADKLLVLMDGRSVYSPLHSGVFWDVQDTMMPDIDRIEVIRGPAGALWGENAVNGVINIITKDAADTQGLLLQGGGGSQELDSISERYGWQLGDNTYARVYAKHFNDGQTKLTDSGDGGDNWDMTQGGFRIDSQPSSDNHFTFQGDIYQGAEDNSGNGHSDLAGGNAIGSWSHKLANGGDLKLQMYYDRTDRNIPQTFRDDCDTFDLDFQCHLPWGTRQDVTWGLGYRVTDDRLTNSPLISFIPSSRIEQLFSGFVQDEIQIVPDRLRLTIGTKLEHNDFSGFEVQPNVRLLWSIDKRQAAWTAVSRAVRTPTQLDEDVRIVQGPISAVGNPNFVSEDVIAYELGYRVQPTDSLGFDIATYYNNYDHLRSLDLVGSTFFIGNKLQGQTYGVEVGSTWKATNWWSVRAAYSYLKVQLQTTPGSTDITSVATAGNDPQNQVYVRSSMDLPHNIQFDCSVRYVSDLPNENVPGYVAVDARLDWQATRQLNFAIIARNLFDNEHPESGSGITQHVIPRSVFGMVTYQW